MLTLSLKNNIGVKCIGCKFFIRYKSMTHPKIKGNIVGGHIRRARKQAKVTQLQLSVELSVEYGIELSPELISRIESGHRPVRDKELKAIADALGVTPDALFGIKH